MKAKRVTTFKNNVYVFEIYALYGISALSANALFFL